MEEELKLNKIQKKYLKDTTAGRYYDAKEKPGTGEKYNPIQRKYLGKAGWTFDKSGAVKSAPSPDRIKPRQLDGSAAALPSKKEAVRPAAPAPRPRAPKKSAAPLYGGAAKEAGSKAAQGTMVPIAAPGRKNALSPKAAEDPFRIPSAELPDLTLKKTQSPRFGDLRDSGNAYPGQTAAPEKKRKTEDAPFSTDMPREDRTETKVRFALPAADDPLWERWAYRDDRGSGSERIPAERESVRALSSSGERRGRPVVDPDEYLESHFFEADGRVSDPMSQSGILTGESEGQNELPEYSSFDGSPTGNVFEGMEKPIQYFDNNGRQVWADMSTLQGIGVLPDGTYINTTGDQYADTLYEIIRAEATGEISEDEANWRKAELARQIAVGKYPEDREQQEALYRDRLVVFLNRDISYYTEIPDVTDRMDEIIQEAETQMLNELYQIIVSEGSANQGIADFYREQVTNNGPFDIKEWPEFRTHSFFLFNGEIVSRDVLGNILAGYLAKVCMLPDLELRLGAGINQITKSESKREWLWNFGDDPRDTERILQGYGIYWKRHNLWNRW